MNFCKILVDSGMKAGHTCELSHRYFFSERRVGTENTLPFLAPQINAQVCARCDAINFGSKLLSLLIQRN